MQSVEAYWRIRIGSGSQNLKGLGSGSFNIWIRPPLERKLQR